MSFVTFRVQLRNDADRDMRESRMLIERYAKNISHYDQVHSVTVTDEPDLEARDGEVQG